MQGRQPDNDNRDNKGGIENRDNRDNRDNRQYILVGHKVGNNYFEEIRYDDDESDKENIPPDHTR